MRLDDRAADGEPHAHAFRLCRHERLEQPVRHLRDYPRPGIGNGNLDRATAFAMRLYDNQSLRAVRGRNRIYRVSQKVEQDLFDLNVVGQDRRQVGIDPRFDFDLVLDCLDTSKADRGVDQRSDLDEGASPRSAAHKLTQSAEYISCAFGLLDDFRNALVYRRRFGRSPGQKAQTAARVSCDCGQRLAELVRQGSSHLTGERDSRDMSQLSLVLAGSSLGFSPKGDVTNDQGILLGAAHVATPNAERDRDTCPLARRASS